MSLPRKQRLFTPKEYLMLEREAPYKSEYVNGEIFAMAGASAAHNTICGNLYGIIWSRLQGSSCRFFPSDQRTAVRAAAMYTYPDASIVCGDAVFDDAMLDTLINPCALFEVLSPSTEDYDRGEKFEYYRQIPSLQEYVLIAQDRPLVEHRWRDDAGEWQTRNCSGLQSELNLHSAPCLLKLADLYDRVTWES